MTLTLFLDHDNIPYARVSPRTLIKEWLDRIDDLVGEHVPLTVELRAYGGWFLETTVTDSRFSAAEFYQRSLPVAFLHRGRPCKLAFSFADALVSSKSWTRGTTMRITHTVAARPCVQYMKVTPGMEPCQEEYCELNAVRKWAKKRKACTHTECPNSFSDYFERKEQKQVDVHLSVDLLLAAIDAREGDHLAVVSDDWDMLPAIAASSERIRPGVSLSHVRFRPTPTYMDSNLEERGVRIVTLSY